MAKPFKETAVGGFLAKYAPEALTIIGDIFPPAKAITDIVQKVVPSMNPAQQQEFQNAMLEYEKELQNYANEQDDERTRRLEIDMTSDSWLSKNIRPMLLISAFTLFTILTFLNSVTWGLKTPVIYMDILQELLLMAVSFYFVDRTINKAILNNKK